MIKNALFILTFLTCTSLFAQASKDTIIGRWGLIPGQAIGYIFDAKGYVKVLMGDDVIGGEHFVQNGQNCSLKYSVNHKTNPKQIDLIFYVVTPKGNQEVNRTKGIVDFVSKNTMRLTMSTDSSGVRPKAFQQIDVYQRIY